MNYQQNMPQQNSMSNRIKHFVTTWTLQYN